MAEKKQTYQAMTIALPPLHTVLGEIPDPNPTDLRPISRFGAESPADARSTLEKLIGHIKDKK